MEVKYVRQIAKHSLGKISMLSNNNVCDINVFNGNIFPIATFCQKWPNAIVTCSIAISFNNIIFNDKATLEPDASKIESPQR